jgi:proteasome lid subunit RPN8/RPN11
VLARMEPSTYAPQHPTPNPNPPRNIPPLPPPKKKDRVETSPEQMAAATALADRLTQQTGVRTRAIGWFHSHPHITVLPSHVDVHTQAMYQMLEPGFVGLIISVFNRNAATKGHSVSATAFQAAPAGASGAAGLMAAAAGGQLAGMGSGELAGVDSETRDAIRAAAAGESWCIGRAFPFDGERGV